MPRSVLVIVFALVLAGRAFAAETVYQKFSDAGCETLYTDEISATSFCTGPAGTPFLVSDSDARISVTFGGVDRKSHPPFESFAGFNSISDTIEWQITDGVALATIVRWHIEPADGGAGGQVLVVSKVGSENAPGCPVAYVDAMANRGANVLARDAATMIAPNVDCARHIPFYYGRRGPSAGEPMLSPRA